MQGRKPRGILVTAHDIPILQQISRRRTIPWFQVQRARVILAMAGGERVQTVAGRMQCDPSTVWRICRRYEQGGLWLANWYSRRDRKLIQAATMAPPREMV